MGCRYLSRTAAKQPDGYCHCMQSGLIRRIAGLCGLSGKTVARLRGELPLANADENGVVVGLRSRVGRDGRSRPVQYQESRARIMEALEEHPHGSLRTIAALAGTSPETVRRVRARLSDEASNEDIQSSQSSPLLRVVASKSKTWESDAALSTFENATEFTEWFGRTYIDTDLWQCYVSGIPVGRIYEIADEARRRSTSDGT